MKQNGALEPVLHFFAITRVHHYRNASNGGISGYEGETGADDLRLDVA
jgi:hypothetical protein